VNVLMGSIFVLTFVDGTI